MGNINKKNNTKVVFGYLSIINILIILITIVYSYNGGNGAMIIYSGADIIAIISILIGIQFTKTDSRSRNTSRNFYLYFLGFLILAYFISYFIYLFRFFSETIAYGDILILILYHICGVITGLIFLISGYKDIKVTKRFFTRTYYKIQIKFFLYAFLGIIIGAVLAFPVYHFGLSSL